jgi:hypothetical protein
MRRFRAVLGMSRSEPPSGPPPGYGPSQVKSNGVEPAELTEDDLLICCPTVLGFSFGEKLWGEFYLIYSDIDIPLTSSVAEFVVADIKEIEWSSYILSKPRGLRWPSLRSTVDEGSCCPDSGEGCPLHHDREKLAHASAVSDCSVPQLHAIAGGTW